MQAWPKEIGTVTVSYGCLYVGGTADNLYAWTTRPGMAWPASTLRGYDRVTAELDPANGDLIDLVCYLPGERYAEDTDNVDVDGSELTAWIDDNLAGTPYARLARNPV